MLNPNLKKNSSLSAKPQSLREIILKIVAGLGAIILTVLATLYRDELRQAEIYGYPGILLACFIANSTVFLPAPSSVIVFNFGAIYNPILVAIVGGVGAALGDCLGYLAGLAGRTVIQKTMLVTVLESWVGVWSSAAVFIFAFLPLPLFDIVGVLAGTSNMRWHKFAPPLLAGKILKMLIYAYAGAGLIPLLEPYIALLTKK